MSPESSAEPMSPDPPPARAAKRIGACFEVDDVEFRWAAPPVVTRNTEERILGLLARARREDEIADYLADEQQAREHEERIASLAVPSFEEMWGPNGEVARSNISPPPSPPLTPTQLVVEVRDREACVYGCRMCT